MKGKNYIKSFDSFLEKSMNIVIDNPCYARCMLKYTHSRSRIILKVTDDKKWALYKLTKEEQMEELEKYIKIMAQLLSNSQFTSDQIEEELNDNSPEKKKKNRKQKKRV